MKVEVRRIAVNHWMHKLPSNKELGVKTIDEKMKLLYEAGLREALHELPVNRLSSSERNGKSKIKYRVIQLDGG